MMKKKIGPRQVIIDRRSSTVNLQLYEKFLKEYAKRRLNLSAYEKSWKIVSEVVDSHESQQPTDESVGLKLGVV